MNEKRAREILSQSIQDDNSLNGVDVLWVSNNKIVRLDGEFEAEELQAIAWWISNKLDLNAN